MAADGNIGRQDRKGGFWNFIDRIEGDKVVWIIVFALTLISALAIFSSTSLLAGGSRDRMDLMKEHALFIILGYAFIYAIYRIKSIRTIRVVSQLGFIFSLIPLVILDLHLDLGFIKAAYINSAWRTLKMGPIQIHVFEMVKVFMVMYLAWALHSYSQDCEAIAKNRKSPTFSIANRLAKRKNLAFLRSPRAKRWIYLYIPVIIVTALVKPGSNSSMILIGGICFLMLLIGKMPFKEIAGIIGAAVAVLGLLIGIYYASDKTIFKEMRFDEMFSRFDEYDIDRLKEAEKEHGLKSREWYMVRDQIRQPYSAKIAIHEGGIFGKFCGNSTQKYVVAHIYSDYMFSFLVEEYGLLGGIIILMLFISLLARGSWIASLCQNDFAKYAVGGLSLLISGQAFLHILVNVDIGPMTGQTLPMISDGSFAFIMFCIAFGIILSISKMARQQIREEEERLKTLYEKKDDVQTSMDVLEMIDNDDYGIR